MEEDTETHAPPPYADHTTPLIQGFNQEEKSAYDAIMAAVGGVQHHRNSRSFFLDGPARAGKTHLLNYFSYILEATRAVGENHVVVSMVWPGPS